MSTVINDSAALSLAAPSNSMFWRFVWKEFRMIRGLWLAVAIMGLLVQIMERLLLVHPPSSPDPDLPSMVLSTALAAAVLYAVGAAATTFSVEHEEETYDLLARLPTTWWPPYAAKLLVSLVSALLLAGALSISALLLRGPNPITREVAYVSLAMLGFAIIEAVAWGTLFSLLIKRPLLAAIITLVVGIGVVNVAVNYWSTYTTASLTPAAYTQALPIRAAIVVAVFASTLLAARNWLDVGTRPTISTRSRLKEQLAPYLARILVRARANVHPVAVGASRRRVLARLLWQTWCENWKLLLAPLGVAFLLLAGMGAALGLTHAYGEVAIFAMGCAAFFGPALYGSMAFYSDQRRGSYRFLADHAARPRYTWLARHIVWLAALVTVWLLLLGGFAALVWSRQEFNSRQMFRYYLEWGVHPHATLMMYDLAFGAEIVLRIVVTGSYGALVAYGIGQFFSMAVRSEILAAFLALLTTMFVAAWVFIVCLWQLSATMFLLPLFLGLMLATWLRAPDWISGRNSLRAWVKPVLAIIAPILLFATLLPGARFAQLQPRIRPGQTPFFYDWDSPSLPKQEFERKIEAFRAGDTTEAARTADMYTRVAAQLTAGNSEDLLKPWRKPEYQDDSSPVVGGIEIDEKKIPPDQLEGFAKARKQQLELIKQAIAASVNEAIEISKRPSCRFHFDPSSLDPAARKTRPGQLIGINANRTYENINQLIAVVAGEPMTTADNPARRFLAALKMERDLRSGQPAIVVIEQLKAEQAILNRIGKWSLEEGRTKDELSDVLDKLNAEFSRPRSIAEALLADHLLMLNVIEGKDLPCILNITPVAPAAHLAYLANQLWWERARAVEALNRITRKNIWELNSLTNNLSGTTPRELGHTTLRHWLRPDYGGLPEYWQIEEPAAVTSYLVSLEYQLRVPISALNRAYCDNETCRNGTILQLALALYRLDRKRYPQQLADLVPEYLEQLPLDPYDHQPFQYMPFGLNHPLRYWRTDGPSEKLAPNTPFFWSIGAGTARLKLNVRDQAPSEADVPLAPGEDEPSLEVKPQYEFADEEQGWHGERTLAFPLRK